jgi:hypothetical protein
MVAVSVADESESVNGRLIAMSVLPVPLEFTRIGSLVGVALIIPAMVTVLESAFAPVIFVPLAMA